MDDVLKGAFRIPHDDPPRYLVVITAYVDESGQEQQEWMCVAGFMGNDESWRNFPSKWKIAIAPRDHLHMNKLRFKRDSERKMLEKAAAVSRECGLIPVVGGVRPADYIDLIDGSEHSRLLSGYILCCTAIVIQVLLGLPKGERFEIVFEQQDRYRQLAEIAMQSIADSRDLRGEDGKRKLADWRSVPKNTTPLTEPADYLAHALLQLWRDPNSRKTAWCRPILDQHNFQGVGAIMKRDRVREIIRSGTSTEALEEARRSMRDE